jgi:predicted dehydrogenase
MGKQYVKALRALGVQHIRVCSRSGGPLEELRSMTGVEAVAGGFERLECRPKGDELGIIATPTLSLVAAAERLASLGFCRLLIEKPVSLWSREIEQLAGMLERKGVEAACAYNRVAYPSFHEVRARAMREGGITSCTYTFTEMIKSDWPDRFPAEELARWGIANSLHPISMAHGLIGYVATWSGHRSGALPWHPTGSVFVGSGISDLGIPFTYHADWGSTGRWSVEVHTRVASYRLCPLEKVFGKTSATGDWEEIPIVTLAPEVKVGFVEQVAAMLSETIRQMVCLVSLRTAAALTRYGEKVFAYE